ncbi:MAG: bifunctional pyr operon transcriptional regulator/uracil phosphoribosyltransferase PyrR [Acholeplasmatales bacterium]|nr:MAG: bifunctional pyr operon transcriptional regulator/uracil phosphoribosyltransferase PyrR [Acholeplasmatales bacterium]
MKTLFDHEQVIRTLRRMTHEILEREKALDALVLMGIKRNGVPVAKQIQANLKAFEQLDIPVYGLDISGYRDDRPTTGHPLPDVNLRDRHVVLVDDVLFTGRSVRAAMDALIDLGRPAKVTLAVLVDRGHRELPIKADYVGKNIPTAKHERIVVNLETGGGILLTEEGETDDGDH